MPRCIDCVHCFRVLERYGDFECTKFNYAGPKRLVLVRYEATGVYMWCSGFHFRESKAENSDEVLQSFDFEMS